MQSSFGIPHCFRKLANDLLFQAFLNQHADVVWHATGTAAMGRPEDAMACVDTEFKVRGVEGLRVADLSVCPFVPNTHTQSTAYVVGWIAAKKIIAAAGGEMNGINGIA